MLVSSSPGTLPVLQHFSKVTKAQVVLQASASSIPEGVVHLILETLTHLLFAYLEPKFTPHPSGTMGINQWRVHLPFERKRVQNRN